MAHHPRSNGFFRSIVAALSLAAGASGTATAQNVIGTTTIGSSPRVIAVNPVNNKTYITQHGSGTVRVIDGATGAVVNVDTADPPDAPNSLVIDPATRRIMVTTDRGLSYITGDTNALYAVDHLGLPNGRILGAVAVNPASRFAFPLDTAHSLIWPFDFDDSGTLIGTLCPNAVSTNPVTRRIYVTHGCVGSVFRFSDNSFDQSTFTTAANPVGVAVNPVTNTIYVAHGGTTGVVVVDGATEATTPIATGFFAPSDIAVNPATNKVYVANSATGSVRVIDGATNGTTLVMTGANPQAIAIDNVRNQVYVANQGDWTVTAIDGATNTPTQLMVAPFPTSLTVNSITSLVSVVSASGNSLTTIDGRTYTHAPIAAANPVAAAVNPFTRRAYIARFNPGRLTVVDETDDSVVTSVTVGSDPNHVAVDPVLNRIYTSNSTTSDVTVVDGVSNTVVTTIPVAASPGAIAVNPVTHRVYVAHAAAGQVTTFDGTDPGFVTHDIPVSGSPAALAVNPVTDTIYAADSSPAGLHAVIDGPTRGVSYLTAAGPVPFATDVAVNPATHRVYVARPGAGAVDEFDGVTRDRINSFALSGAVDLAVNTITNRVYVATGTNALGIIDAAASSVECVMLPQSTSFVAVDEPADRIYVATTFTFFTIDGPSGNVSRTVSPAAESAPGKPAVDPTTNKAYAPVATSAHAIVIKEATPPTLTNHGIVATLPLGNLTSSDTATISATVCCDYAPGNPAARIVHYTVADVHGGFADAAGIAPASATLTNLPLGLHYVTLFATDDMASSSISAPTATSGGTSFFVGAPTVFPLVRIAAPVVSAASLPDGKEGVAYSQAVTATGGTGGYVFSLAGGNFPPGLALGADGSIAGTPTSNGLYVFQVAATDTSGGTGTATQAITVAVGDPKISVAPTSLAFGSLLVGASTAAQSVTVGNIAYGSLAVGTAGITGANPGDFAIASNNCASLAQGASCIIQVTFTPVAAGVRAASLAIPSNDAATPTATVTLGGSGIAIDTTPDAFAFTGVTGVALGSTQVSNTVTITGINSPAPISVSGGTYSIGCTGTFVLGASTIASGQTVCVRHTAAATLDTATNTTLTVGGVSSTFTSTTLLATFMLITESVGTGSGTITGTGFNCPGDCTETVVTGTVLVLTANAVAGSVVTRWTGCDSVTTNQCTVTVTSDRLAIATFEALFTVTAAADGVGSGTITGTGFNCPGDCAETVSSGTALTLTAAAAPGSLFVQWTGCDVEPSLGQCLVNVGSSRTVTATFTRISTITAALAGTGTGTITGPAFNCPGDCTETAPVGVVLTLFANAATGSVLSGWSGCTTVTANKCTVLVGGSNQTVTATFDLPVTESRLSNISTRGQVQTGFDVMIGGFVISGSGPKTVVVRAIGPSLANFGVSGAISNPTLELVRSSDNSVIATNDDWGSAANAADVTASGFAPSNPLESAILATLQPGAYTAIVSGVGGVTGVGLVEVYEVDHPEIPLINISTRGQVQTDFNVMIGGFVIQGSDPETVIIRAIGPSLANFGVAGALANPTMSLVRMSDNATIAINDDWGNAANAAQITSSGFAPSNPLESAILMTLAPGAYTAVVSGVSGGTGVGLVEVYKVP